MGNVCGLMGIWYGYMDINMDINMEYKCDHGQKMHYVPRLGDGHQSIVATTWPHCDATRDGMGVSPSPLGAENFRPKNSRKNYQEWRVRWNIASLLLELTFWPSGAPEHWKNTLFRDFFYLVAHLHLLSSDSFSSLIFFLLLFSSLTALTPAASFVHIRKAILNGVANPIIKLHSHLGMVSAASI